MLLVTWVADPFRPTRDLDLLGSGDNAAEAIAQIFRVICVQPVVDDGVIFDVAALDAPPIREEAEYRGVRVRTMATIDGARILGDAITPAPHLRAYLVEMVVAEKFETLVTLGMANSRLKDFYVRGAAVRGRDR